MISCANAMGLAIPTATALVSLGFHESGEGGKKKGAALNGGLLNTSSKRCVSAFPLMSLDNTKSSWVMGARRLITKKSQRALTQVFISVFSCGVVIIFPCNFSPFFSLSMAFCSLLGFSLDLL